AVSGGKRAFLQLAPGLPMRQMAEQGYSRRAILQIPDDIDPDEKVLQLCAQLREKGWKLAIHDTMLPRASEEFLDLVDYVFVDFIRVEQGERPRLVEIAHEHDAAAVAGPVRTHEEWEQARNWGYDYFRGYFFAKPDLREGKQISGNRLIYLRMLAEISQPGISYEKIEELIRRDVSLTHSLLRFMNSAWFGFRSEIRSVRHALVLLGPTEIKKWFTLIALRYMGSEKPDELVVQSLIRARVAEMLAARAGREEEKGELFLVGMLSLIDALTDLPMQRVLDELPLHERIKSALLGSEGPHGEVLDLVLTFEVGWWGMLGEFAPTLQVEPERLGELFAEARAWADASRSVHV
ncbi:MAG: EAL and HDOD domain-containing protein, partial [Planctomycetota bacterium]